MASAFLDRVSNKALGELLVEKGALTEAQVTEALELSKRENVRLGEALVSLGYISRDSLGYAIGEQYGLRPMELQPSMVDLDLVSRFDYELLSSHNMLPLIELGNELVVVVGDPNDQQGLAALARLIPSHSITPQLGTPTQIRRCLEAVHSHLIHTPTEAPPLAVTAETADLTARILPDFPSPPGPESADFPEWLISLAAAHPEQDVIVREIDDSVQVSLTPSASAESSDDTDTGLTEVSRWQGAHTAPVRHVLTLRSIPIEHTRGQAARWVYPGTNQAGTYDFMIFMPIVHGAPVIRIRAICHFHDGVHDEAPSVPLSPSLEAGQYTVVLYDKSCSLEQALSHFVAEHAASHQFLIIQQATRCAIPGAPAFPAPFTNVVAAVQAIAATCVIFDHPVEYREAARLLTSTYPPPAVLVCAPLPSHASGAGSLSPDVQELISRQDAQSLRLLESGQENRTDTTTQGKN